WRVGPLHVPAGSDQGGGLAVGEEGVVGYGWKGRVPEQHVGRLRTRHVTTFPASGSLRHAHAARGCPHHVSMQGRFLPVRGRGGGAASRAAVTHRLESAGSMTSSISK